MKSKKLLLLLALSVTPLTVFAMKDHSSTHSAYSGLETREITALSAEQIQSLLDGSGMGYALSAELNKYPGPKHVLELQKELNLTDTQLNQTQSLFNEMQQAAQQLGKQLIHEEKVLDKIFRAASASITPQEVQQQVAIISTKESELRSLHLVTHLKQKELLSIEQQTMYQQLRGYDVHGADAFKHSGNH